MNKIPTLQHRTQKKVYNYHIHTYLPNKLFDERIILLYIGNIYIKTAFDYFLFIKPQYRIYYYHISF